MSPLVKTIEDKSVPLDVRGAACQALTDLGDHAQGALTSLVDVYFDQANSSLQQNLRLAIARSGKKTVPLLLPRIGKGNSFLVRYEAMELLAMLGPLAKDALPLLSDLTEDPDRFISDEAWSAIRRINEYHK